MEWIGVEWGGWAGFVRLDWTGLDWSGLDCIGLGLRRGGRSGMDWVGNWKGKYMHTVHKSVLIVVAFLQEALCVLQD